MVGPRVEILGITIVLIATIGYVQSLVVVDTLRTPKVIDEFSLVACINLADQKC